METKIIFVGGCWEQDRDSEIFVNSVGPVQNAANIFQHSLIKGLDRFSEEGVTVLSSIFIGAYPYNYRKMFVSTYKFSHLANKKKLDDWYIGFNNLPIIKHIDRTIRSKYVIRKILKNNSNKQIIVIGYSMTIAPIKTLLYAKKLNKSIKTCLIVPDLPEYMNLGKRTIKEIFKKISNKLVYNDVNKIDSFVFLTKYMAEKIDITNKKMCIVEGIATEKNICKKEELDGYKKIVYTGTLDRKYGVCSLVDAFMSLSGNNLRLVICGYGDSSKYIEDKARVDRRIVFLGSVDNSTCRIIQKNAFLLVNPRNSNEEYTKYSFPSKTLEYMLSGKPVLTYKLKGIPNEYDEYLIYVKVSLLDSIKKVLMYDDYKLRRIGERAREFALSEKNLYKQTDKIYEMLK